MEKWKDCLVLSFKGCIQAVRNEAGEFAEKFDWAGAAADAAIIAMLGFFSSLAGAFAADVPYGESLIAAAIAAGVQFFGLLALKRQITKVKTD